MAETARQTQIYANLMAAEFKKREFESTVGPVSRLIYRIGDLYDPDLIGTVVLGYNHFLQELGPLFQQYITNLVASATSVKDFEDKIAQLQAQHHHLFDCQVVPGFDFQAATKEIPDFNAWIAQVIVPISAASIRNIELWGAVSKKFGLRGLGGLVKSWFRKRDVDASDTGLASRGSWDENLTTTEDYFLALGYTAPLLPALKPHFINWVPPSRPSPDVGPAEFSSLTRNGSTPTTVTRTLSNVSYASAVLGSACVVDDEELWKQV